MFSALYRPQGAAAGAAGVRAHAMATGLRAAGHSVTVVCARSPGNARRRDAGVEVLPAPWVDVEDRARRVGVELRNLPRPRGPSGVPRNTLLRELVARGTIPDRYVIWIPGAAALARRHGNTADVVISTGPVSAHLAAQLVVRGRRWLIDINDLWALNPQRSSGRLREAVNVFLEQRTLDAATQLTTVNDAMRDELRQRTGKPVTTLLSGFDPDEFASVQPERSGPPRVRLLYAGALYPTQNLEPLLEVLAVQRARLGLSPADIELSFIGRVTDRAVLEAKRFGVGDLVTARDPIARDDLLRRMCAADALILPLNDVDRSALPIKVFEYIGAGRPILAWGQRDSVAGRIILDHGLGVVASDPGELGGYISRLLVGGEPLPSGDDNARAQFTWRRTIDALVELVNAT